MPRVVRLNEECKSEMQKQNITDGKGHRLRKRMSDASLPSTSCLLMLLLLHSAWRDRRWWAGHPGVWVDNRDGSTSSCWGWLVNLHGRWVSGRNIWHRLRVEREGWCDLLDMLSWRRLR